MGAKTGIGGTATQQPDGTWHPILFSGTMVRAILDGRKTQTRRVVKVPDRPVITDNGFLYVKRADDGSPEYDREAHDLIKSPYGWKGDRLWVRETFQDFCPVWN